MKKLENIVYGSFPESTVMDIYLPEGEVKSTFLYFHGGGLTGGDKASSKVFAEYLTARGIALATANYRMYPEAKYPDFVIDAANAASFIRGFMKRETGTEKLFIGGSSAGGYLSMMLCFDKRYLTNSGVAPSSIAGYFHDAGQPTSHFNVLKERGCDSRRIIVDESAPIYFVGLEEKYPRMRFIVSDDDMKGRYEQTMMMLSTLEHFGYKNFDHRVMHGKHCAYCSRTDECGDGVLGKMIYDFIKDSEN